MRLTEIKSQGMRDLVGLALRLGWTAQQNKQGVLIIHAPDADGTVNQMLVIPSDQRSVNDQKLASWTAKVIKYGVPEKVREWREERAAEARAKEAREVEAAKDQQPLPEAGPDDRYESRKNASGNWEYKCPDCDTWWPDTRAMGGHRRTHAYARGDSKRQQAQTALELIIETAQDALGVKEDAELKKLRSENRRLEQALADAEAKLAAQKEVVDKLQDLLGNITAAVHKVTQ